MKDVMRRVFATNDETQRLLSPTLMVFVGGLVVERQGDAAQVA